MSLYNLNPLHAVSLYILTHCTQEPIHLNPQHTVSLYILSHGTQWAYTWSHKLDCTSGSLVFVDSATYIRQVPCVSDLGLHHDRSCNFPIFCLPNPIQCHSRRECPLLENSLAGLVYRSWKCQFRELASGPCLWLLLGKGSSLWTRKETLENQENDSEGENSPGLSTCNDIAPLCKTAEQDLWLS